MALILEFDLLPCASVFAMPYRSERTIPYNEADKKVGKIRSPKDDECKKLRNKGLLKDEQRAETAELFTKMPAVLTQLFLFLNRRPSRFPCPLEFCRWPPDFL